MHFLDASRGWLVGKHGLWLTTNGGLTESSWAPAALLDVTGAYLDPALIELYAIDVVERGAGVLGLATAEPGIILRSDPQGTVFQVVWDIHDLCNTPGVLTGCEAYVCNTPPAVYEPWDVEISRNPSSGMKLALVVGGIGGFQCGFIVSSTDDGSNWVKELHECNADVACTNNSAYNPTPDPTHTYRHQSFKTLYGVAILDGDNGAVAAGYNGQHVYREPATGVWRDRSSFSNRPVEAPTAVVFPLFGAVADTGTIASGTAVLTGSGGHVRRTVNVSSDPAPPWADDLKGEPWRTTDVHFVDESHGWQVGQFFRIAKTMDGGFIWTPQLPLPVVPASGGLQAITFQPTTVGDVGVTVGSSDSSSAWPNKPKILYTLFGGAPPGWSEPLMITVIPGTNWDNKTLRDVEWISGQEFCAVGESGLIFRTADGGASWTQLADRSMTIASFQKYEFEGVAFLDPNNGVIVGWMLTAPGARALAYKKVGSVATWTSIAPVDPDIDVIADVKILGTSAYAVGQRKTTSGSGREGVILRSDYAGGSFGQLAPISPHPLIPACDAGDDLSRIPVLNEIAVNPSNGDIWVGGECGRVWRFMSAAGWWVEQKSQTDGHVTGMSLTPTGHLFVHGYRQTGTSQCLTHWTP